VTAACNNDRALTRRRHQMAALADLGQLALAEHNLDAVLAAAVRSLAGGLESPFAEVACFDDAQQVTLLASIGMDATVPPGPPRGADDQRQGIDSFTWLITAPDPLVVNDWRDETRCHQDITMQVLGARSCVSVAIHTHTGVWGFLTGSDHQTRQFTVHDANFARGISHLIAAAVERHDVEEQLRWQAVHDPLTRLPNRSLLLDRLTDAFERRDVHPVTLGFVDLDDFSAVNNRSGHTVGDQVLAEVARRLAGQVRHGDTVARIGGDEFIVILEGLNDAEALAIAHRILDAVRHPIHLPGLPHSITVTASIGLAALRDTHQIPEHLIGAADEAMYAAKTRGGDVVMV
jgi:diguanylate cyclase (GGDEF)-like protein